MGLWNSIIAVLKRTNKRAGNPVIQKQHLQNYINDSLHYCLQTTQLLYILPTR